MSTRNYNGHYCKDCKRLTRPSHGTTGGSGWGGVAGAGTPYTLDTDWPAALIPQQQQTVPHRVARGRAEGVLGPRDLAAAGGGGVQEEGVVLHQLLDVDRPRDQQGVQGPRPGNGNLRREIFQKKPLKIFYFFTCNCFVRVTGGGGGGGYLLTPILGLENLRDNLLKRNCARVSLGKALCVRAGAGGGAASRRSSRSRMVASLCLRSNVTCPECPVSTRRYCPHTVQSMHTVQSVQSMHTVHIRPCADCSAGSVVAVCWLR